MDPYSIILFKCGGYVAVALVGIYCIVFLFCVVVLGVLSSLALILQRWHKRFP